MSHCSEEHLLQVQQHGVTSNIWRCNILVCRYSVTNDAFRHKLMWCCTSRLTSAVAFLPANSFLSVLCASRVLVLENGKMAEFDSPSNLISQRGAFHKMAKDSGLVWSRGVSLCRASCLLLQRAVVSNERDTVLRANDLLLCFETSSSFHCTRRLGLPT